MNEEIKKQFEEMNRKCDEAYGCGKFPPEVWQFIEQNLSTIRREAVGEFDRVITEKLKIAEDEITKCDNGNSTSFAEDGGEVLLGQINAYEELLNYLKEKQ